MSQPVGQTRVRAQGEAEPAAAARTDGGGLARVAELVSREQGRKRRRDRLVTLVVVGALVLGAAAFSVVRALEPDPPVLAEGNRTPAVPPMPAQPVLGTTAIPEIATDGTGHVEDPQPATLPGGLALAVDEGERTHLRAIDLDSGEVAWSADLTALLPEHVPEGRARWRDLLTVPEHGTVVLRVTGSTLGSGVLLVGLDGADGSLLWSRTAPEGDWSVDVDPTRDGTGDVVLSQLTSRGGFSLVDLTRIDSRTGEERWRGSVPGRLSTGRASVVGTRIFTSLGESATVVDAATGDLVEGWSRRCLTNLDGTDVGPADLGPLLLARRDDVRSVCDSSGRQLWYSRERLVGVADQWDEPGAEPRVTSQVLELGARTALRDAATGEVLWSVAGLPPLERYEERVERSGDVLGYRTEDRTWAAVSAVDGTLLWEVPLTGRVLWTSDQVVLRSGDDVVALDQATGAREWSFPLPDTVNDGRSRFWQVGGFPMVLVGETWLRLET